MQRILYPVLSWLASFGSSAWVPASLVLINLAGVGAVAASAAWLTRRVGLAWWFPFAVAGWPGFLVALTHDTAEIIEAAACLAALAFYLSNRLVAYCVMVAAATLTRETAIPFFLGPLIYESAAAVSSPTLPRLRRATLCALAFVPFGIWHAIVGALWNETAQPLVGAPDLGWPLMGVSKMLLAQLNGGPDYEAGTTATLARRVFVAATTIGLIGFCIVVVTHLRKVVAIPGAAGLAIGWFLVLLLMSLLTWTGPWAGPQAYFRVFTECWIFGCLLLALAPMRFAVSNVIRVLAAVAAADVVFTVWRLCFNVLPT